MLESKQIAIRYTKEREFTLIRGLRGLIKFPGQNYSMTGIDELRRPKIGSKAFLGRESCRICIIDTNNNPRRYQEIFGKKSHWGSIWIKSNNLIQNTTKKV